MAFKRENIEVVSAIDGEKVKSILLRCPKCNGAEFLFILVGKEEYEHIQCITCGQSFCKHEGSCQPPGRN